MQLEDYFTFQSPDDIRVNGTRIGIETILYDHIHRGRTPEEIQRSYPVLTLEQVYATILYYLHNSERVSAYLTDWLEAGRRARQEQDVNPPPAVQRLKRINAALGEIAPDQRQDALHRLLAAESAMRRQPEAEAA
jgi:uncharacterized protein (DUF433 family)